MLPEVATNELAGRRQCQEHEQCRSALAGPQFQHGPRTDLCDERVQIQVVSLIVGGDRLKLGLLRIRSSQGSVALRGCPDVQRMSASFKRGPPRPAWSAKHRCRLSPPVQSALQTDEI